MGIAGNPFQPPPLGGYQGYQGSFGVPPQASYGPQPPLPPDPSAPAAPAAPTPATPGGQYITPAMMQALLQMHAGTQQQEVIERQRKMADMLRASGAAQMKGTQAGRIYRAPNALNALSTLAGGYVANQMDEKGDAASKALGVTQGQAARQVIEQMTGKPMPEPSPPNPFMQDSGTQDDGGTYGGAALNWFRNRFNRKG